MPLLLLRSTTKSRGCCYRRHAAAGLGAERIQFLQAGTSGINISVVGHMYWQRPEVRTSCNWKCIIVLLLHSMQLAGAAMSSGGMRWLLSGICL